MVPTPFSVRLDEDPLSRNTPGGHGFVTERERDAIPALRLEKAAAPETPYALSTAAWRLSGDM